MKKSSQDMLHELGEVNPVYAYYNSSRTSKDNEDPSQRLNLMINKIFIRESLDPRDSPLDLEAYSDSDYARDSPLDLEAYSDNETVYKEWEDRMEMAVTTSSSLEAEHDSSNINRTQSMAIPNKPLPRGTGSGSSPRCQVTILRVQKLKPGLRLHLNSPMILLSQEFTHLEVGRTSLN
nr:hypothetical protein [Tanacetum cinerariifolium]